MTVDPLAQECGDGLKQPGFVDLFQDRVLRIILVALGGLVSGTLYRNFAPCTKLS
jgi:hypothetical protein